MKRIKKHIAIIAFIMAFIIIAELPISALENVIENSQSEPIDTIYEKDDSIESSSIIGELKDERSEYTKTFRLENGNNLLVQYSIPIHYKSNNDEWVNYDATLKEENILVKRHISEEQKEISDKGSEQNVVESFAVETVAAKAETPTTISQESETTETSKTETEPNNSIETSVPNDGAAEVRSAEVDLTEKKEVLSSEFDKYNISFSKTASDNNMIIIGKGEKAVSWGYKDIKAQAVKQDEDKTEYTGNDKYTALKNLTSKVKYQSAYKNVDIELISSPIGVKENIILNSKDATNSFVSEYNIGELKAKQLNDRVIALYNKDDEVEYYISAEYMYDNKGEHCDNLQLKALINDNGILTIELIADSGWLNAPEREYPITIDPSFYIGQQWSSIQSAYVDSTEPNVPHGNSPENGNHYFLYTGSSSGSDKYRSYIKMIDLPEFNAGDMLVDVTFNMHITKNTLYQNEYIGLYNVLDNWNSQTLTWNNKPSYDPELIDYLCIKPSSEVGWYSWNITELAKRWYDGSNNNGFMLKGLSENMNTWLEYYSSNFTIDSTPRPAFAITFRNNKGIEDYWSNTSVNLGNAGSLYVNDYSGALTYIAPMASTASPIMSAGLNYVYNSYMAREKYNKSTPYTGRGWRMSVQQTLFQTDSDILTSEGTERFPYVYTDADGTDHYIYKDTDSNPVKYKDEDGLNLELTIGNNNDTMYTLTDKDKNKLIFKNNGLLRYIKDPYNNTTTINYSGRNITSITDASNNVINFTINDTYNNYIRKVNDPATRNVILNHIEFSPNEGGYISRITRPDDTYADFTYDSNGLLTSVIKSDGYKVTITYDKKKVSEIAEYTLSNNTYTLHNKINFDRTKYNTTVIQSSGDNGLWDDDDDIISTYQFDNWGRTKSVQSMRKDDEDLGAANYEYTSGSPNSNGTNIDYINRVTSNHVVGSNTFNYLINHGFETGSKWTNSEWIDSNTFTGIYIANYRAFGRRAYRIKTTDFENHSAGRAYQDVYVRQSNNENEDKFKLIPGETYTLSGYIKVAIFNGNLDDSGALIAATSFNSNGTTDDFYSERISEVTDTSINNGWRRVSVTFTVPQNSELIRVNIALKSATGSAFFDGIQLEKGKTAGSYNLLENSSFENCETNTQPYSWNNTLNLTYSLSSEDDGCRKTQKLHGLRSFKLNGEITENKYICQVVPVSGEEEDTYIVSGWAKAESIPINSDNNRKFKISIAVNYTDGSQVFKESADFNPTISGWQYISKAFNLSDGTSANKEPFSIEVYPNYSKEGNAAYFDNFSLVKEPAKSYTYDSKGNLISVTSNAKQNSEMEYNTDNKLTNVLDPKGGSYQYTYNNYGAVDTATTQNGAVYTYEYNDNGIVTKAVGVGTDNVRVRSRQSISYNNTSTEYSVTSYDLRDLNSVSTYDAKTGTLKEFKDNKGITTEYTYEPSNDLIKTVTKNGQTIEYSYENNYRDLSKIKTLTTEYSLEYNSLGLRQKTKAGDHTLASYTQTNSGLLESMTYGNNTTVNYHYDKFGNVDEKKVNDVTVYEGIADNTGAITKVIDPVNNLRYDNTYDSTDRLISSTITNTANNRRKAMFEYEFDLNNNLSKLTTLTSNGRNKVRYNYGNDNRLEEVTLNNNKKVTYTYNGIGQLTSRTVGLTTNPITTTYTYHGIQENQTVYKNNLIRIETIGNNDFTYYYKYDKNNNIIQIFNGDQETDDQLEDYTYDDLGQMTKAEYLNRNKRYEYTYGNGGNITEERIYNTSGSTDVLTTTNTYTYGDNSWGDLLTSYNGDTITYDAIGNPLQYRNGISFTWANGRQLQSYAKGSTNVSYTYDSNGMRLSKTVNGVTRNYLYNNGLLMQEIIDNQRILDYSYDSAGNPISVAYRTSLEGSPTYYYFALNSRGDVIGIYAANGSLLVVYDYDAWGNVLSVKTANGVNIANPNSIANIQSLRYRGYCYDTDSGLYYLQSRYYDPVTHRFINSDSQINDDFLGFNLFAYCSNNPVNCSDPSGEAWWHWALGAAVVIGCAVATVVTCGGFAAAAVAVSSVACGVAASSTAATIAASAFIASAVTFTACVSYAAETSSSVKEFNSKGNWGTVGAVAASAVFGGGCGYALSSTGYTSRGSTAKIQPRNLTEQLALEEVKSSPNGRTIMSQLNDSRWPATERWVKKAQTVTTQYYKIDVHYLYSDSLKVFDDFKIAGVSINNDAFK